MAVLTENYWQSFVGETIRGNTAWSNVYHIQKFLGRGAYGGVFKAQQDDTKELVAVKLMLPADDGAREIKTALKVPPHSNLIKHIEAIEVDLKGAPMYVLVMELADGGSLRDLLNQRILNGVEVKKIAIDIVEGLKHLHSIDATGSEEQKRVHRDMKPENVLQVKGVWKIADFGLAKVLENGSMQASKTAGGTPQYMPPELLQRPNIVSTKWDIWSFGVILAEMLARERPFDSSQPDADERENEIYRKILAAKPNIPNVPKEWLPIIEGCLVKKHKSRWAAADVLKALESNAGSPNLSEIIERSRTERRLNSLESNVGSRTERRSTRKSVGNEQSKTKRQRSDQSKKTQASFKTVLYILVVIAMVFTGVMNRHLIPLIHGNILNTSWSKKDALAKYQEAISIKPDDSYAYFQSAYVKSELGDKQGAIADYNEAIRLKPDYADAYYNRGLEKYSLERSELGDKQGVIADYNEAIRLKPDYADAYYNRGLANHARSFANYNTDLGKSDNQRAIADYTEAIRLKPDYADAYDNRGNAKSALGDKQGAITDYNEAIRLKPDDALAYVSRGNAKSELGDKQGAIADYNEAIRLNPDSGWAYRKRGITYQNLGEKQKALALLGLRGIMYNKIRI